MAVANSQAGWNFEPTTQNLYVCSCVIVNIQALFLKHTFEQKAECYIVSSHFSSPDGHIFTTTKPIILICCWSVLAWGWEPGNEASWNIYKWQSYIESAFLGLNTNLRRWARASNSKIFLGWVYTQTTPTCCILCMQVLRQRSHCFEIFCYSPADVYTLNLHSIGASNIQRLVQSLSILQ